MQNQINNDNIDLEKLKNYIVELTNNIDGLKLPSSKERKLEEQIMELKKALESERVCNHSALGSVLSSVKNILENCVGNVTANYLLQIFPF